jgi:sulfofructose kinase
MAEVVVFGLVAADVILRVQRIPGPGDQVNAEALGWRIGGSSANVACGLSTAGHHVRLVGPVGTDPMGDNLLAELEQYGVETEYTFRADAASPRTLILLDDTGECTIIAMDSEAGPSSFLPLRAGSQVSRLRLHRGLHRYPTGTATAAESALLVTSPPVPGATTWPATVVVGSETQYPDVTPAGMFEAVRSVSGERLKWMVVTRGREGADAYAASSELHVDAVPADQIDATGAGDALTVGLLQGRHGHSVAARRLKVALMSVSGPGDAMRLTPCWVIRQQEHTEYPVTA